MHAQSVLRRAGILSLLAVSLLGPVPAAWAQTSPTITELPPDKWPAQPTKGTTTLGGVWTCVSIVTVWPGTRSTPTRTTRDVPCGYRKVDYPAPRPASPGTGWYCSDGYNTTPTYRAFNTAHSCGFKQGTIPTIQLSGLTWRRVDAVAGAEGSAPASVGPALSPFDEARQKCLQAGTPEGIRDCLEAYRRTGVARPENFNPFIADQAVDYVPTDAMRDFLLNVDLATFAVRSNLRPFVNFVEDVYVRDMSLVGRKPSWEDYGVSDALVVRDPEWLAFSQRYPNVDLRARGPEYMWAADRIDAARAEAAAAAERAVDEAENLPAPENSSLLPNWFRARKNLQAGTIEVALGNTDQWVDVENFVSLEATMESLAIPTDSYGAPEG